MTEHGGAAHGELTASELQALGRSPMEQLAALADAGEPAEVVLERFDRLVRATSGFIEGFHAFAGAVVEYVAAAGDHRALTQLARAVFAGHVRAAERWGCTPGAVAAVRDPSPARRAFAERLAAGDRDGALGAYGELEAALRAVHGAAAEGVTAHLSHVYRTGGIDELEACLRHCGERTLLAWMPRDLQRPPAARVRQWASMLAGNFARLRVQETPEAFVITQDPCGTCSRQILAGAYDGPDGHAVVRERHRITWDRGDVPVYRTHVAVMHDLMPLERIGQRWPEIDCPAGVAAGPCRVVLRKDAALSP